MMYINEFCEENKENKADKIENPDQKADKPAVVRSLLILKQSIENAIVSSKTETNNIKLVSIFLGYLRVIFEKPH